MSDTVIRVENLAKKYVLGHQEEGSSYKTFRGAMTNAAKSLGNALNPRAKKEVKASKEEFWALKDVSFEIKQGDRVGIIGRNGAGKSTLLKVLSRITEPTSGSIRIKGRVASLLEVGTGFHPELTGRENIFLNGAILGMSRVEIQRKFDEIVAFAEVEKFLDTPVKRYSSGMYVRLAFAVAAHLEPEILIVDEVLAVGDVKFQKKCIGKMEEVGKEGRTILFVSHNMATIQRLCNSAFLFSRGKIAACGKPSQITDLYLKDGEEFEQSLSWKRTIPSTQNVFFEKIYLSDSREEKSEYITTGCALKVTVEFVIKQKWSNLQLRVCLLDSHKEQIFSSAPQDAGLSSPEEPGKYHATVYFPAELFFPKTYGIKAVLWSPDFGDLDMIDNLRFEVQETASLCNSTPLGRSGLILLRLDWQIEKY